MSTQQQTSEIDQLLDMLAKATGKSPVENPFKGPQLEKCPACQQLVVRRDDGSIARHQRMMGGNRIASCFGRIDNG